MKKQTDRPFNSLYDLCERFPDDKSCRKYLENHYWNDKPFCPYCGNDDRIYRFKDGKLFKCGTCRNQFTVTVGTIFHGSHVPLKKWLWAIFLFSSHKKGISSCQLAKDLKIQQKTAWFMLGRIRKLMAKPDGKSLLKGIIETDESYFGGKQSNKHAIKKIKGTQGRSLKGKTPLFGLKLRNGEIRVFKVKNTSKKELLPAISKNVHPKSILITDEWRGYRGIKKYFEQHIINHGKKEYVRKDTTKDGKLIHIHNNGIENFWSMIKRGFNTYHQVSPKHINLYAAEFAFRYNTRDAENEVERFNLMLNKCGERTTYKELIGKAA